MNKFKMVDSNTCSRCGNRIAAGEAVYAASYDAVRSGVGICEKCAAPARPAAKEPEVIEPMIGEGNLAEDGPLPEFSTEERVSPAPAKKATGRKK